MIDNAVVQQQYNTDYNLEGILVNPQGESSTIL